MFKQLKQLLDFSGKSKRADQPVAVLGRLQRACAQQAVDRERRIQLKSGATAPADRPVRAAHETQLDIERTPCAAAEAIARRTDNDTRVVVRQQLPEPVPTPAGPSLLQRVRTWFRGPEVIRAERRQAPRHPFGRLHPHMRALVGPCKWPAQVTDVSATGIGLIIGMRHRLGADLQLTIQDRSRGSAYPIKSKVKRLALRPDGTWFTCCAFDRPLDEAGLKSML
ncbi:MAG: PilZ domain-containing protein [Planctomycetia bacterium]|nr:PilZ domain-containing protein [Planctomycetia bacterium]